MPPDIPEKRVSSPAVERNGAELCHPTTHIEIKPLTGDFAVCDQCGGAMTLVEYLSGRGECCECRAESAFWWRGMVRVVSTGGTDSDRRKRDA